MEWLLGWVFRPLAWLMGVPWRDSLQVGSLLGIKTVVNEFVGYFTLRPTSRANRWWRQRPGDERRTKRSVTYALCGFANFSSIAILLGRLGGHGPRTTASRSPVSACSAVHGRDFFSNLMSAAIAGLFISLS